MNKLDSFRINKNELNLIRRGSEKNSSNEQKGKWEQKLDELEKQLKEKQAEKEEQREKAIEDWKQKQSEKKKQREETRE